MKRKSNKCYVLYCILAVTIFIYGCGNGSSVAGSQKGNEMKQEEISYVLQSLSLPEYEAFDAYSVGNDLYYAASGFDQASQQYETVFYILKQGAAEPEMNFRLADNQLVLSMTMDAEGNLYYLGYEEVPGNGQTTPDLTLYKLDQKGVPLLTLDIKEYTRGQDQAIIQNLAVDGENRIVLFSSNQNILVLDPAGNRLFEARADGMISDICSSGGKVYVAYGGINGMEIREIDVPGKKLSAKLEHNIPGNQFYMAAGRNADLLIATEESIYRYDPEMKETVKKFDWQTYDFTGISAGILLPYGENGVLAISRNYGTVPMKIEATAFREAAEGEAATQEKTVLTLGVPYLLPASIKAEIVYFNKANPDYKIEVKSYDEDYTRLYTELMTGNGPDLLALPSHRIEQLSESGLLEDLNPYFAGDETLDRSEFLENILEAFETEGHLYWMPLDFDIYTMVGKTSVLGDKSGWNLDELITFAENVPKGTDIFDNTSQSGVLRLLKFGFTGQLVDTDNTVNPLNRELLVRMLEFANQYENDDQYIHDANLIGKVGEEQVILLDTLLYAGHGYFAYSSLFGEPVTFIGFPSEGRNGNLIYSMNVFAISSSSEHKDIAWKFISTLLSEEAQMRMEDDYTTKGFHIRKDALEYHFTWAKEHFGVYSFYVTSGDGFSYRNITGELKDEDIDPVRNLIQNADMVMATSADIDQIIEEEAAFYFSGTKPVAEVVEVIENRVRTYVNETK